MTNQDTPETNDAQWGTGKVTTDFARRLERERDEVHRENARLRELLARAIRFVDAFEPRSHAAEVDQQETLTLARGILSNAALTGLSG